jgi:ankyrin repeat protein
MESDRVSGGLTDLAVYLQEGGDPDVCVGPNKAPLLHIAFESMLLEPLELLLQSGADIDVADSLGRTLLHLAVDSDVDGAVQNAWPLTMAWTRLALRLGADVALATAEGQTPGDIARAYGPLAERAFVQALRQARPSPRYTAD